MNALASTLVTERKRRGLTQAQVAASIGVSRAYIVHLEKGQELKRSRALTRLTKLYGVDLATIPSIRIKEENAQTLTDEEKALVLAIRLGNKNKALRLALTLMTGRSFSVKSDTKTSALAPLLLEGRKSKGLTQEEAANLLGIARGSLSMIEQGGEREPSSRVLKKMAQLYDLDFEELLQIKVSKNKGPGSLSRLEKKLIDTVRAKDTSTAFEIIDDLIHT